MSKFFPTLVTLIYTLHVQS